MTSKPSEGCLRYQVGVLICYLKVYILYVHNCSSWVLKRPTNISESACISAIYILDTVDMSLGGYTGDNDYGIMLPYCWGFLNRKI